MKRLVGTVLALLTLLVLVAVPAAGAEEEWDPEALAALDAWVCAEEDLNALFAVYGSVPLTRCGWSREVTERLFAEPVGFMRALSLEEPEKQRAIVKTVTSFVYFGLNPGIAEFPQLIGSVTLDASDTDGTKQVLTLFEDAVAEYWSMSNPKTGDPVGIVMTAMAICSLICAFMILFNKKKD